MAIAVTAFAFTAILGLMTTGLRVFHQTENISVTSQIAGQVFSQINSMSFDTLTGTTYYGTLSTTPYRLPCKSNGTTTYTRYFTAQGQQTTASDPTGIYSVNVEVTPSTSILSTGTAVSNADLATVTVQVAYNPGQLTPNPDSSSTDSTAHLWSGTAGSGSIPLQIITFQSLIARHSGNS